MYRNLNARQKDLQAITAVTLHRRLASKGRGGHRPWLGGGLNIALGGAAIGAPSFLPLAAAALVGVLGRPAPDHFSLPTPRTLRPPNRPGATGRRRRRTRDRHTGPHRTDRSNKSTLVQFGDGTRPGGDGD